MAQLGGSGDPRHVINDGDHTHHVIEIDDGDSSDHSHAINIDHGDESAGEPAGARNNPKIQIFRTF